MGAQGIGRIAFGKTRSGVVAGVVLDCAANRFEVLLPEGRRESWASEKLFWLSEVRVSLVSLGTAVSEVRAFLEKVRAIEVDLETLWEVVAEDPKEWEVEELAQILFGKAAPEHKAALACALVSDEVLFKQGQRPGVFTPRPPEAVEQMRLYRQRQEQEEELFNRVLEALEAATDPENRASANERDLQKAIEWLRALAVGDGNERDIVRGTKLVQAYSRGESGDAQYKAFNLLVRLGVFGEDEILGLHRYKVPLRFPEQVLEEAKCVGEMVLAEASRNKAIVARGSVAIDDSWTTDVDDALWLEDLGRTVRVHVLIADPSRLIPLDSAVAQEGMARAATLYLPNKKIPMFPEVISEHVFSLEPGAPKPMLDFYGDFDIEGNLVAFNIEPIWGILEKRLTYDECDEVLTGKRESPYKPILEILYALALNLRKQREKKGAIIFEKDEVSVRVVGGEIVVKRIKADSPSRRLVSEFMVFACTQAAQFARENGIPVVYRRQSPPEQHADIDGLTPASKPWIYKMMRIMKRAELSIHPEPHFGLGVSAYTQVTSPLRRFQDFVVHWQITRFLKDGKAPLSADDILQMFGDLEERGEARAHIEKEAKRYFLLKYLQRLEGCELRGEVLAIQGKRAIVELTDTCLEVPVLGASDLPLGTEVKVRISEVQPRRDKIVVRLA